MEVLPIILTILGSIVYICIFAVVFAVVVAVSVIAAKKLCEDKGLGKNMMWVGLLGWLGLVILCFMKPKAEAPVCEEPACEEAVCVTEE
ncbi:MAG: hypothetical protein E7460_01950 [Ruminococcaceae bacterium]|nr:hypothetical protein [Oscillospiraceae bacterium]